MPFLDLFLLLEQTLQREIESAKFIFCQFKIHVLFLLLRLDALYNGPYPSQGGNPANNNVEKKSVRVYARRRGRLPPWPRSYFLVSAALCLTELGGQGAKRALMSVGNRAEKSIPATQIMVMIMNSAKQCRSLLSAI